MKFHSDEAAKTAPVKFSLDDMMRSEILGQITSGEDDFVFGPGGDATVQSEINAWLGNRYMVICVFGDEYPDGAPEPSQRLLEMTSPINNRLLLPPGAWGQFVYEPGTNTHSASANDSANTWWARWLEVDSVGQARAAIEALRGSQDTEYGIFSKHCPLQFSATAAVYFNPMTVFDNPNGIEDPESEQ